jgi:ectoine hydroxylase-related dioxygenase (phytanoyl-CoA dioxygenase family)
MHMVSEAEVQAFRRDGVACLRGVVGASWLDRLAEAAERDIRDPGPFWHRYETSSGRFHGNSVCWIRHKEFEDYVFDSPLPELAAALTGSEKINLLYDQLFIKEPGTNAPTPWHHDHCVWPLLGQQVVSFWLALDRVDSGNGRVEYVKGSHRWEGLMQPQSFTKSAITYEPDPRFIPGPDIEGNRDRYDIVSWDLEPGDVVAFYSRTFHGAGTMVESTRRRRGYTVRYCGDDVTYDPSFKFMPALRNPELGPGDPLDSKLFPVVWKAGQRPPRPTAPAIEELLAGTQ